MKKKPETMTKNELLEQHMKAHPFLEETGHLFLSLQAVLADTVTPVELPEGFYTELEKYERGEQSMKEAAAHCGS